MFKVAIPSYKRHETISDKTLATLRRGGVAISDIYIFVVLDEQEAYEKACPGYQIIPGLLGLVQQRAFIQGFFDKDTYILMIDDDIEQIFRPIDSKTRQEITDIPSLISQMKVRMISENVTICGIYPCNNLKFALGNKEITTDFRFLVGVFYLIKNIQCTELQLDPSEPATLDDKIRTIKYYQKEGKCLRFNWVQVKTKYFTNTGGNWSPDRLKLHAAAAEAVCLRFPKYLRLAKTSKMVDAKFKKIKI
jgi:hypothetical protein